jgi:hypothetical protein
VTNQDKKLEFRWGIKSFSPRKLTFKIEFDDPLEISNEVIFIYFDIIVSSLSLSKVFTKWLLCGQIHFKGDCPKLFNDREGAKADDPLK